MFPKQSGFGLPTALFVILVIILIVAAINTLNQINADTYGRQWLSLRAFYAAESGANLAATYFLSDLTAPACSNSFINNLNLSGNGLNDCLINVSCEQQSDNGEDFFTLTSTGQCGQGSGQTTRIIQIRVKAEIGP
ncbi:hypothetical protein HF888_15355 [Bermanella marisrubri]|uniref:MSHA biogenesis protein MshP n=1 Tax=Bermanella marisrubri TaxID=207949 RepID=Q1N2G9_9GAMM|nr:hypothetical protein [Bermanella marisrubri]EAT12438.1 hypothetical protein RED65_16411 [Oceanobacter sp. RED65] [Bermanella marisrubri]QIZ85518.1 hypothetical protein HF888_15355 [Bermanella marisrubri]